MYPSKDEDKIDKQKIIDLLRERSKSKNKKKGEEKEKKKKEKKKIGSKKPLKEPTRSSDKQKPKKKREDPYSVQKERVTTIQPPVAVNLGIITWNVAHFGAEPIDLQKGCSVGIAVLRKLLTNLNKDYLDWLGTFENWLGTVANAASGFTLIAQSLRSLERMVMRNAGLSRVAYQDLEARCSAFATFWRTDRLTDNDFHGSWDFLFVDCRNMGRSLKEMRATLRRLREPMNRVERLKKFFEHHKTELPALSALSWQNSYYINEAWNAIITLDKMAHRILIMKNIVHMFKVNKWLDVVALHEVNQGIDILATCMDQNGLTCIPGPHLKSVSGRNAQDEYYPIIVRADLNMSVHQRFAFFNDGTRLWGLKDKQELNWSKKGNVYRPIVGYEIRLERWGWRMAMVAIVHTTPYGKEFERQNVFGQVELPLNAFSYSSIPVTVSGDYYLTAETAVYAMRDLDLEKEDKIYVREYWKWYKGELEKLNAKRAGEELQKAFEVKSGEMEVEKKEVLTEGDGEDEDDEDDDAEDSDPVREIDIVNKFDAFRNEFGLTFASEVKDMQLDLLQPITGTNWKTKEVLRWRAAQIADFYVVKHWRTTAVGIPDPDGGVAWADNEAMTTSQFWRVSSDHWPVAAYLSTDDETDRVNAIFHLMADV